METEWTLHALEPAMGVYELSDMGLGTKLWSSTRETSASTSELLHRPLPRSSNSASEHCATLCCSCRQHPLFWRPLICGVVKEPWEDHIFPVTSSCCYLLLSSSLRDPDTCHASTLQFSGPQASALRRSPSLQGWPLLCSHCSLFSSFHYSPWEVRVVLLCLILPHPRHLQADWCQPFCFFRSRAEGGETPQCLCGLWSWMTHWGLLTGVVNYEKIPRSQHATSRSPLVLFPIKKRSLSGHYWELSFPCASEGSKLPLKPRRRNLTQRQFIHSTKAKFIQRDCITLKLIHEK